MHSTAATPADYIDALPDSRKEAMTRLRQVILANLPTGFEEVMNYGMIGYVVPHSLYPSGYHCDPKLPLPFINIASQKNFIAIYHMGLYADKDLAEWFTGQFIKELKVKPDMGKSCLRFKKPGQVPFDLIGTLASKWTPSEWILIYEKNFKK